MVYSANRLIIASFLINWEQWTHMLYNSYTKHIPQLFNVSQWFKRLSYCIYNSGCGVDLYVDIYWWYAYVSFMSNMSLAREPSTETCYVNYIQSEIWQYWHFDQYWIILSDWIYMHHITFFMHKNII